MKATVRDYSMRRIPYRRHDLGAMANEIASHVPRMWKQSTTEDEFWRWFCGELQSVVRNAADMQEGDRLHGRLLAALTRAGLPPPPPRFQVRC